MRRLLCIGLLWGVLAGAEAPAKVEKTPPEKEKTLFFTAAKPYGGDKWKYFCCPVKKLVRRTEAKEKWIDYCYNSRDELIGFHRRNASGSVKRSDFVSVPGCTLCGNRTLQKKSWRHNTRPGVVIPPAKKRKR